MDIRKFGFCALFLCLTGCNTTQTPLHLTKPVPAARLFVKSPTPCKDGDGQITVIRDSGVFGSGCYIDFSIDGKLQATYDTEEIATFCTSVGEHALKVGFSGRGLCSASAPVVREGFVNAKVGKTYRIFTSMATGTTDIVRAD